MRDHIEHFDEKLDNYLYDPQKPVSGYIFPELVADIDDNEGTPHHIFRGIIYKQEFFRFSMNKLKSIHWLKKSLKFQRNLEENQKYDSINPSRS